VLIFEYARNIPSRHYLTYNARLFRPPPVRTGVFTRSPYTYDILYISVWFVQVYTRRTNACAFHLGKKNVPFSFSNRRPIVEITRFRQNTRLGGGGKREGRPDNNPAKIYYRRTHRVLYTNTCVHMYTSTSDKRAVTVFTRTITIIGARV